MKQSRSEFQNINGVRLHVRIWGGNSAPVLFLLHGWMDASASFQFVVDELRHDWKIVAPDWRGCGLSGRPTDHYWFPDYYADLEGLLATYQPDTPALIAGHSMGGVIASTYAGIRPERIARIISLEGFGLTRTTPDEAPPRVRRWLDELTTEPRFRSYADFDALAARLISENPRLDDRRAQHIARAWAAETAEGQIDLLHDPRHKRANPVLFRIEELIACWKQVTAPVLWVFARDSKGTGYLSDTPEQLTERKQAFRHYHEAWIEDAGHMMHHDQPRATAELIESFMHR